MKLINFCHLVLSRQLLELYFPLSTPIHRPSQSGANKAKERLYLAFYFKRLSHLSGNGSCSLDLDFKLFFAPLCCDRTLNTGFFIVSLDCS